MFQTAVDLLRIHVCDWCLLAVFIPLGDIVIDPEVESCPKICENF